jgi:2-desacetyl-2-hydroxyethyl bacteriochlorophyllide A dehydrogenase
MAESAPALVVTDIGKVEQRKLPVPARQAGEVKIEALYSLLSPGTEMSIALGDRMENAKFPYVPGYQGVGRIVEAAGAFQEGDLVMYLGGRTEAPVNPVWGAHQKTIVCGTESLIPVPKSLQPADAALAPLFAVGMHGVNLAQVAPSDVVVVLGHGLIGAGAAQAARARGAFVIVSEPDATRRELAARYAANLVVDPKSESLADAVRSVLPEGARGADVVLESSGVAALIEPGMELCRFGARYVFQGWYPGDISFSFMAAHRRQLTLHCPTGWGPVGTKEAALRLAAAGIFQTAPYLSHRIPAAEAADGYRLAMGPERSRILGMVFDWQS